MNRARRWLYFVETPGQVTRRSILQLFCQIHGSPSYQHAQVRPDIQSKATEMWANVVKQAKAPAAPGQALFTSAEGCKVVIVDANAIINGIRLEGIADKAVTIQEVLAEVRDKQSRQFLASLAIKIEIAEPSEESIKAGALARRRRPAGLPPLSRVSQPPPSLRRPPPAASRSILRSTPTHTIYITHHSDAVRARDRGHPRPLHRRHQAARAGPHPGALDARRRPPEGAPQPGGWFVVAFWMYLR
jgi:hypothetical protein